MKNNNTAHDGFLIKTPLSQLNPSSTTADTLFSGCVTVEAGSANPRCNFLSFDNHNYINLSIAALSTSHYCLHSMDKDHCTKGISAANVKVQEPHKVPNIILICVRAIQHHLIHHLCYLLTLRGFPFNALLHLTSVPRRREAFRNGSTVSKGSTKQWFSDNKGNAVLRNKFPLFSDFSFYYKHFFSIKKISPSDKKKSKNLKKCTSTRNH